MICFLRVFRIVWLVSLLLLGSIQYASAQDSSQVNRDRCATQPLSLAERSRLSQQMQLAYRLKKASPQFDPVAPSFVPVRPHIVRRANGTGGLSLRGLNNLMAINNSYFLGGSVYFYFCGTSPDYINNDAMFNGFTSTHEDEIADVRDVNTAMNAYFVNTFSSGGLLGYAYYPGFSLYTTRSFIKTGGGVAERYVGDYVINHELGHNFDLPHTFEGSTSPGAELVVRPPSVSANCATAGDEICDTPADPFDRSGATKTTVAGCDVYTGTITDAMGLTYTPQMNNIMSYWDGCGPVFTAGQHDRINAGLAFRQSASSTFGSYSLNCAPTLVAMPTSLTAFRNPANMMVVRWTDNASNEMGYFIERATSATGLFLPVGGVAPNTTEYIDASVMPNTTYWYRVRPSNSTTNGVSSAASATMGASVCRLNFLDACIDGDGLNSLTVNGVAMSTNTGCSVSGYRAAAASLPNVPTGQPIRLSGQLLSTTRPERVTVWVDANRNGVFENGERYYNPLGTATTSFTGTMTIPTSTSAGPVNMRIMVRYNGATGDACGSYTLGEMEDYTLNVLGSCAAPTGLASTTIAGPASTHNRRVQWTAVAGATYSLTVLEAGNPSPLTTVSGLTSNTFVTALSFGTSVTISVQTTCTNTVTSLPATLTLATPAPPGGCTTMHTVKAGDWSDPTVWSCNRLPLSTDVVYVRHAVTVPSNAPANVQRIVFEAAPVPRVSTNQQAVIRLE